MEDPDRFVGPDGKTGNSDWAKHGVDVQGAAPLKVSYHGIPRAKQQIADEQVDKMLEQGIIEPSDSPWAFPTVLVTKEDGSIRFCVDFRKFNFLSRKDSYPLPRIDETLNTLGGPEWFCTMDLASGYWQVNMEEADKPKTAFMTRKGLFQFRVMPFGLSNAPATFQRLMDNVLRGLQWEKCLVYLDDIIVFGKTFSETLDNLRCVMQRLKAANLKLKASKCQWFRQSVKYLGHIVSKDGIACDPEKTEVIQSWPVPSMVTHVRQFIGFASYYRKFIPNYSEIAQPLTHLTKKSVRFNWSQDCQKAFDSLKEKLASPPVLAYPKDEGEYILDTDASNHAIGAVLSQIQDGEERVISFRSWALCGGQQNYCTTKRGIISCRNLCGAFPLFSVWPAFHHSIRPCIAEMAKKFQKYWWPFGALASNTRKIRLYHHPPKGASTCQCRWPLTLASQKMSSKWLPSLHDGSLLSHCATTSRCDRWVPEGLVKSGSIWLAARGSCDEKNHRLAWDLFRAS